MPNQSTTAVTCIAVRTKSLRAAIATSILVGGTVLAAGGPPPAEPSGPASSGDVVLLVLYVVLALGISFLCSIAEAVLLSITPSFVASLRESRPALAARLQQLKNENVDQSLAAILTLNTIAHTVGAIGSGAKATIVFGSAWFGLFSAVMTLMMLFLSEIIPKTLGAVHWRALAGPTALFVRWLILLLFPLIWLSEKLTQLIARGRKVHAFSRDEFIAMADVGAESGAFASHETQVLANLFQLNALQAKDVMTPRTVIMAHQQDQPINAVVGNGRSLPFSRMPLYEQSLDDADAFVLRADALLAIAENRGADTLASIKRQLPSIPADTSLAKLLEFLLDNRQHVALVVGEFGATVGLVTLEDVVETLLGIEIVDELDTVEDMQSLARQRWQARAEARGLKLDAADKN